MLDLMLPKLLVLHEFRFRLPGKMRKSTAHEKTHAQGEKNAKNIKKFMIFAEP